MDKKEFFKDKRRKITNTIFGLTKIHSVYSPDKRGAYKRYTDKEVVNLRKLSNELQKQVHELNAGRNIFLDNDKDLK